MKFFETSKYYSLNKTTYIKLRWIAVIGQLLTINVVKFIFNFEFNFILCNLIILGVVLSNLYLIYFHKEINLNSKLAFLFLNLDIFQLSFLLYLTGGVINPFIVFLIIPCIFSSNYLDIKTNLLLVLITISSIIFMTFFNEGLPKPLNQHFHISNYYYYSIPIALCIALIFLNFFGLQFGLEAKSRKEALDKMQEMIAQEHELLSLGGQAAAAAHSFGTPLSTIKIISQDLLEQLRDNDILKKDVELLVSQVNRCNDILKKLTLNPIVEDEFIDNNITIKEYINEIVKSFEQISNKKFILDYEKDSKYISFIKSIEIVYGLRNFIGNANKFAKEKIYIAVKNDQNIINVVIEDDGAGFSREVLNKIGEPFIKSHKKEDKSKSGLGLGIFIGKTLLEKNQAKIIFKNSNIHGGGEVNISWKNKDLLNL
jgi:two-component system, sensor histidine kinase RegB